jgi:gluconate 2-dehydrogenase alpha chain
VVYRDGKAEGVSYVDYGGNETFQPADVVILASWTLNNARLLLLSGIGERYNPVTRQGTLGKNLTHQGGAATQVFLDQHLNNFMGAGALGYTLSDFDGDHGLDPASGILRGALIRMNSGGEGPISAFGKVPPGEVKSNWGSEWKKAALKWHDRVPTITCEAEHLAYRHNFVDLDPTYADKFGDPLLRLTLDWTDHERRQAAMASKVQQTLGKAMGGRVGGAVRGIGAHYNVTDYQSTHVQGGAIMGASPETSVVNSWCQHWNMSNLFVVGGSAFPQNASVNPTLTVMAVMYRAVDALIDRYLKRPGALA